MKALLVVDVQNDFCPGGALAVPEGDQVVPLINRLTGHFDVILNTQDWHPSGHHSFASSHEGKEPFDVVKMDYGDQVLWPDHCVQGSPGSRFHPDLDITSSQLIVRKGFRKEIDSYSAFFENDQKTVTGLAGYLKDRKIDTLYVTGLAADFCVKWTVLDAIKLGFQVNVVEDAVRGIDLDGSLEQAWDEMTRAGAKTTSSKSLL
ncbi:MAG: bifunctional nicotinamidase/pyrazinamidase [Cyclonatronaceae bacterium]